MPPKQKSKSRIGSAGPKGWEQELLLASFCEENVWTASIALVVESKVEDSDCVVALGSAINKGVRKLFTCLSQEDLLNQVKELGGSTTKGQKGKSKDGPQYAEVCEVCKPYIDAGEELPLPLLAQLIKFRLMAIKDGDQKRRELESKAGSNNAVKGGKGDKNPGNKSPVKGGKGAVGAQKKGAEQASPKMESKLKKRGEAELESKFINDEPEDGPQHYVVLTGFYHSHLLTFLADIGVSVDCVVRVERQASVEGLGDSSSQPLAASVSVSAVDPLEEQRRLQQKRLDLERFWRDSWPIMDRAPENSSLHDVARLSYVVDHEMFKIPADETVDVKSVLGSAIFDDISVLMYNLSDAKRHWKNYLANVKLIHVPSVAALAPHLDIKSGFPAAGGIDLQPPPITVTAPQPPSTSRLLESTVPLISHSETDLKVMVPTSTPSDVDMRFYNELMNSVPLESTSVPLILHCMVEQVCASEENRQIQTDAPLAPRTDGLDSSLADHLGAVVFKLALTDEQKMTLYNEFSAPPDEKQNGPLKTILVNHNDNIRRRLIHLKNSENLNVIEAELEMLGYTALSKQLLDGLSMPTCNKAANERAARLQSLLHFFSVQGLINKEELVHAMNQFIFECMDVATVDDEGNLDTRSKNSSQRNIPWDDPYPYYVGMVPLVDDEVDDQRENLDQRATDDNKADSSSAIRLDSAAEVASRSSMTRSGSILKRKGSSDSRRNVSSAHSVHFEADGDEDDLQQQQQQSGENEEVGPAFQCSSLGKSASTAEDAMATAGQDLMDIVNNARKRSLDPWCFAEYMEPHVLIQSMLKALETNSCVDIYRHRRDHSLLVIMHNPQHEQTHHSLVNWHVQLHSNVRFRNYLEHVAGTIVEWIQQEEAKYQATLLAAEVEKLQKEETEASQQSKDDGKKRERSKSPKKTGRSSRSPSTSPERPASAASSPYIRAGSIKAWKEEQERARIEQELEEKNAEEKRSKSKGSPRPKAAAADTAEKSESGDKQQSKDKKKNDAANKSGRKSASSSNKSVSDNAEPPEQTEVQEEKYWPFVGYDMGGSLVEVTGTVAKMFPSDGGQIKTERIQFVQGSTTVKANLLKDGHTFSVHILDPQLSVVSVNKDIKVEKVNEQQSQEIDSPKSDIQVPDNEDTTVPDEMPTQTFENTKATSKPGVGRFGSFTAQFSDGMVIALSTYGPTGQPADIKPYEPEPYKVPEPLSPSPVVGKEAGKGKGGKGATDKHSGKEKEKEKEKDKIPEPVREEIKVEPVEPSEQPQPVQPQFQQLYVSCPDGLSVTYFVDSSAGVPENDGVAPLLVRQSYPLKTRGSQSCEAARRRAMEEASRVITSDGTVVRTLTDGTTQILYADGTVKELRASSPLLPAALTAAQEPVESTTKIVSSSTLYNKKSKLNAQQSKSDIADLLPSSPLGKVDDLSSMFVSAAETDKLYWITTLPSGERLAKRCTDEDEVSIQKANVCIMSDPQTSQVMHSRDDHVVTVYYPDGTTVVEHADGTRITTVRQEVQVTEVSDNLEATPNVSRQCVTKLILIECTGFATVRFDDESGLCTTEFGSSGATIDCLPIDGGSYAIFPSSAEADVISDVKGCLRIDCDGTAVYYPNRSEASTPTVESEELRAPVYYIMRHSDDVVIETVDAEGCHYFVTRTGENHIGIADDASVVAGAKQQDACDDITLPAEPEIAPPANGSDLERPLSPTLFTEVNEDVLDLTKETTSVSVTSLAKTQTKIETYGEHAPRLYVLNSCGGSELLRQSDIADYLIAAERDPRSVVLTERLPDCADIISITVLRNSANTVSDHWLRPYIHQTVIPRGLQTTCPAPKPIPDYGSSDQATHRFASRVGKGLSIGTLQPAQKTASSLQPPSLECPPVLEFRQILQFNPVTDDVRSRMEAGLQAYANHVKEQMRAKKEYAVEDPRSDNEKEHAAAALAEVLRHSKPPPLENDIEQLYTKAITCGYVHTPPATPVVPRKKADLEKIQREIEEGRKCRRALSERSVPPYFESDIYASLMSKQIFDKAALRQQVWGNTSCEGNSLPTVSVLRSCESQGEHVNIPSVVIREATKTSVAASMDENNEHGNINVIVNDESQHGCADEQLQEPGNQSDGQLVHEEGQDLPMQNVDKPIPRGCHKTIEAINAGRNGSVSNDASLQRLGWQEEESIGNSANGDITGARDDQQPQLRTDQDDDIQFTMVPLTGKLADFLSSKPEDLPQFVSNLDDTQNFNCSNSQNVEVETNVDTDTVQNGEAKNDAEVHSERDCEPLNNGVAAAVSPKDDADKVTVDQVFPQTADSHACSSSDQSHTEPVRVPAYLHNYGRPGATPNTKFAQVEDPVRRKVNNTAVTAATLKGLETLSRLRGLSVQPEKVDFGMLKEGCTYSISIKLKNTGIDSCRFRIRQPPPSTGIKVLYAPGPVAAGLKTDINIEIYAIAAGVEGDRGVGHISHNLQITTETDNLVVPITATVLTASEFESRSPDSPRSFKAPGVKLVSTKPPSGIGVIRPPRRSGNVQESVLVN